uniref:G_PROTEIN_RECEP_F3_4 domain-containing protein n=1 Tax=Macrostomum lignano TaxID=282301 RepID=A0A1I8GUJ6_9PLAT
GPGCTFISCFHGCRRPGAVEQQVEGARTAGFGGWMGRLERDAGRGGESPGRLSEFGMERIPPSRHHSPAPANHFSYIKMSSPQMNNLIVLGCALCYLSVIFLGLDSGTLGSRPGLFVRICSVAQSFLASKEFIWPTHTSAGCGGGPLGPGPVLRSPCRPRSPTRAWVLSIGFTLSFGAMFSKTWRVHCIFTNISMSKKIIKDYQLMLIVVFLLLIDIAILLAWMISDPMWRERGLLSVEKLSNDRELHFYREVCESHRLTLWLGLLFAYKGLLLVVGCFFAWETRHVSIPALNDSKYIGMSVYNVLVMCIAGAAVSFALKDNNSASFIILSTLIFFSTTITLGLVFFPKLIELRRDPRGEEKRVRATLRKVPKRPVEEDQCSIVRLNKLTEENEQLRVKLDKKMGEIRSMEDELRVYKQQDSSKGSSCSSDRGFSEDRPARGVRFLTDESPARPPSGAKLRQATTAAAVSFHQEFSEDDRRRLTASEEPDPEAEEQQVWVRRRSRDSDCRFNKRHGAGDSRQSVSAEEAFDREIADLQERLLSDLPSIGENSPARPHCRQQRLRRGADPVLPKEFPRLHLALRETAILDSADHGSAAGRLRLLLQRHGLWRRRRRPDSLARVTQSEGVDELREASTSAGQAATGPSPSTGRHSCLRLSRPKRRPPLAAVTPDSFASVGAVTSTFDCGSAIEARCCQVVSVIVLPATPAVEPLKRGGGGVKAAELERKMMDCEAAVNKLSSLQSESEAASSDRDHVTTPLATWLATLDPGDVRDAPCRCCGLPPPAPGCCACAEAGNGGSGCELRPDAELLFTSAMPPPAPGVTTPTGGNRRSRSLSISISSRRWVSVSFCWMAMRSSEFSVFLSSSAACSWRCISSIWVTYSSQRWPNMLRRLANPAASSFSDLSSERRRSMVSLTTCFSFWYFCLRLASADSAVALLVFSTERSVAICSRFVFSSARRRAASSRCSAALAAAASVVEAAEGAAAATSARWRRSSRRQSAWLASSSNAVSMATEPASAAAAGLDEVGKPALRLLTGALAQLQVEGAKLGQRQAQLGHGAAASFRCRGNRSVGLLQLGTQVGVDQLEVGLGGHQPGGVVRPLLKLLGAAHAIEVAADQIEVAADQIEVTADQIEVTADQIELTADQIEVAADQIEVTADQIEVTADQIEDEVTADQIEVDHNSPLHRCLIRPAKFGQLGHRLAHQVGRAARRPVGGSGRGGSGSSCGSRIRVGLPELGGHPQLVQRLPDLMRFVGSIRLQHALPTWKAMVNKAMRTRNNCCLTQQQMAVKRCKQRSPGASSASTPTHPHPSHLVVLEAACLQFTAQPLNGRLRLFGPTASRFSFRLALAQLPRQLAVQIVACGMTGGAALELTIGICRRQVSLHASAELLQTVGTQPGVQLPPQRVLGLPLRLQRILGLLQVLVGHRAQSGELLQLAGQDLRLLEQPPPLVFDQLVVQLRPLRLQQLPFQRHVLVSQLGVVGQLAGLPRFQLLDLRVQSSARQTVLKDLILTSDRSERFSASRERTVSASEAASSASRSMSAKRRS